MEQEFRELVRLHHPRMQTRSANLLAAKLAEITADFTASVQTDAGSRGAAYERKLERYLTSVEAVPAWFRDALKERDL